MLFQYHYHSYLRAECIHIFISWKTHRKRNSRRKECASKIIPEDTDTAKMQSYFLFFLLKKEIQQENIFNFDIAGHRWLEDCSNSPFSNKDQYSEWLGIFGNKQKKWTKSIRLYGLYTEFSAKKNRLSLYAPTHSIESLEMSKSNSTSILVEKKMQINFFSRNIFPSYWIGVLFWKYVKSWHSVPQYAQFILAKFMAFAWRHMLAITAAVS